MINNSPIGAGGVLRDIKHTHGALRLTELHRFTDPTEAAATFALREGKPEALNFYLDHDRVHVGDLATTTHMFAQPGCPTRPPDSTQSCSPPPASSSLNSTDKPVIISFAVTRPAARCA